MKTIFAIVLILGLLAASGFAQTCPTGQTVCVTQISNAASEAVSPLPNSSIAQGSYFAIYGVGFGPAFSTCGANNGCLWNPTGDPGFPDAAHPLPTSILGTSVSVAVPAGATPVPAYIEFAAAINSTYSQINAILPSNTPTGTGTLTVTTNGTTTAAVPVTVVASSFGTFAVNSAGTGPGSITNTKYQQLTPFNTAKPGDYVFLWGTGLGPAPNVSTEATAPPSQTNLCATASACPVTVWVGGFKASVPYAGRATYVGEDQIVFIVPPEAGLQGCYVQVAVQIGSVVGNFTSIPVDPAGATCKDVDGIDYADLASAVQSKGHANVGTISMLSNFLNLSFLGTELPWDNDTVSGEIGTFSTEVLDLFQGFALAPSVNNCTVSPFLKYPPPSDPGLAYVTWLDAGSTGGTGSNCGTIGCLSITGPGGTGSVPTHKNNAAPPAYDGKGYSGLVGGATIANLLASTGANPFFLNATGWGTTPSTWTYGILPGTITASGPGGADVGALSAPITVTQAAASFKWTNQAAVSGSPIPRSTPLTINWTGGDTDGFVDITAIASTLQSGLTPLATTPGILVECIAPASAGTFQIPTYVLQSLPPTAGSTATVPPGELLVGPASVTCGGSNPTSAACATAITPPTGLDALYIFYHFIQGANVTWAQ